MNLLLLFLLLQPFEHVSGVRARVVNFPDGNIISVEGGSWHRFSDGPQEERGNWMLLPPEKRAWEIAQEKKLDADHTMSKDRGGCKDSEIVFWSGDGPHCTTLQYDKPRPVIDMTASEMPSIKATWTVTASADTRIDFRASDHKSNYCEGWSAWAKDHGATVVTCNQVVIEGVCTLGAATNELKLEPGITAGQCVQEISSLYQAELERRNAIHEAEMNAVSNEIGKIIAALHQESVHPVKRPVMVPLAPKIKPKK